ncbi:MAG: hypothetical protein WDN46_24145 [Methylocella sp.]
MKITRSHFDIRRIHKGHLQPADATLQFELLSQARDEAQWLSQRTDPASKVFEIDDANLNHEKSDGVYISKVTTVTDSETAHSSGVFVC